MSTRKRLVMPDVAYACEIGHNSPVKPVVWMGSSREDLKGFRKQCRTPWVLSYSGFNVGSSQRIGNR
jgi:hypothetical protein